MEWSPVPLFEERNMKEGTSALEYYVLIYCGLLVYYRWMETHLGIRIKHFSVFHYQTSPSSAREWVSAVLIRSVFLGFWEKGLGWSVQYCILIPSQTGSSLKPGRSLCDGMSFSDQLSGFQNTYPLWLSYCYPAPSQLGQPSLCGTTDCALSTWWQAGACHFQFSLSVLIPLLQDSLLWILLYL